MSKYLESCLHHCGENMARPDVLNNPYCAGCEVYDILQTVEEHVQMKLICEDEPSEDKKERGGFYKLMQKCKES